MCSSKEKQELENASINRSEKKHGKEHTWDEVLLNTTQILKENT